MRKNMLYIISTLFISIFFADEFIFKIGNIKYDYSNLEFTYTGREGSATFTIGKFSFSTMNSDFQFDEISENARLEVGPSKVVLQNLNIDIFENHTRNNIKFDLGTLRFDVTECDFDVIKGDKPRINSFNAKFSTNDINLDLSNVLNFPQEAEGFFSQHGIRLDKISINRANINTSYDERNLFKFDMNGITSLANIKINVLATINEQYPERSNFQICKLTISNLSEEMQTMIGAIQAQSGIVIPMQNGSITFDIKDMLNTGQTPFQF